VSEAHAPPEATAPDWRVWAGFVAMAVGNFMSILDIQIVASSIREIQAGVAASADELVWIQTSYLVAEIIAIPLSGFLGRAMSIRYLWTMAGIGFSLASAACAFAWSIESLIIFRTIQGFMGGALIPTTFAAVFLMFPPKNRPTVQVVIGLIATMAPAIGSTVGGAITEAFGWRWLFLVNLAPGLIASAVVYAFVRIGKPNWALFTKMDWAGLAGLALFLGALQFVLEEGPRQGWLESPEIGWLAVLTVAAGVLFFWRAFTSEEPVVSLKAFRNTNFSIGSGVSFTLGLGLYGAVYLQPLFLGGVLGYSALQIGNVMFVMGTTMFFSAPIVRLFAMSMDPRAAVGIGVLSAALGCFLQTGLTAQSGFWDFFWPQVFRGFGFIFCFVTITNLALGTLPASEIQNASGVFNVTRNLGGAIGLAALNTLKDWYTVFHKTELAPVFDPADPLVQQQLQASAARLAAAGVADPDRAAMAQFGQTLAREATVMAFNNLFFVMGVTFLCILALLPFVQKPEAAPQAAPAH
jgi:MFS transporter, DHA2 family, multidrug resistance protein